MLHTALPLAAVPESECLYYRILQNSKDLYKKAFWSARWSLVCPRLMIKTAKLPLAGKLHYKPDVGLIVTVPRSVAKGLFDALHDVSATFIPPELGFYSYFVVAKENESNRKTLSEVAERGHSIRYKITGIEKVRLAHNSHGNMYCWAAKIRSPEAIEILKKYGLKVPKDNNFWLPFAILSCRKKSASADRNADHNTELSNLHPEVWGKNIYIAPSEIEGLGLHAARPFKKGEVIVPKFVVMIGHDIFGNEIWEQSHASRYTNHASKANAINVRKGKVIDLVAQKDIDKGEEIVVNYFDLNRQFGTNKLLFTYMQKPYDGSSSTGRKFLEGEVIEKEAQEAAPAAPEAAGADSGMMSIVTGLWPFFKFYFLWPWASEGAKARGMIFMPTGPLQTAELMRLMRMRGEAVVGNQAIDVKGVEPFMRGVMSLLGYNPNDPRTWAAARTYSEMVAQYGPQLLMMFGPAVYNLMFPAGSAQALGFNMAQAAQNFRDPRTGLVGTPVSQLVPELYNRLYGGPHASLLADTSGLRTHEIADLMGVAARQGLLGRPGTGPFNAPADEMAERLKALSRLHHAGELVSSQIKQTQIPNIPNT
jgi:hypothetical protein